MIPGFLECGLSVGFEAVFRVVSLVNDAVLLLLMEVRSGFLFCF